MVARHDRKKVHHGRRKKGSRIRKRRWAIKHDMKVRKRYGKRRRSRLSKIARLRHGIK